MSTLDKHQLEITCPECGKIFKRAAGRLNAAKSVKCPGCAAKIMLNKKGFWALDKANAVLGAISRIKSKLRRKKPGDV